MSWRERLSQRFPNMARHGAILRESWRRQDEADRLARPRSDHEFMPAALEIMEKPPSPGLRWLMLSLCGLLVVALVWSVIGRVDVVATASGKVVPVGNVKLIQPIEIGYVRAIHVKNGQHVEAGQLLVELDPTLAGAEAEQASKGLLGAEVDAARNAALLGHLGGRAARFTAPAGTSSEIASTQSQYVRSAIAEYEGERASLMQQRAENAAELASVGAEIAKLEQTLPIVDQQLAARRELSDKGYFSKIRLLEYEQLKIEHVQNIAVQKANAARARATIANIDAQLARLRGSFGKTAATELAESQQQSSLAREEVTKSERRQAFMQLRAPVSGTVQQLAISTVGGVVQPAQTLMIVVPDDATPVVEARILNKDIGFVREGQPVRVKLEAYPFTDYGIVPGVVESISRDAVDTSEPGAAEERDRNGRVVQPGLIYTTRIRLLKRSIRVAGRDQPIGPGLAVQAEIKTSERRIIEFLLSPIAQALDEAGRER
ncbi:HlyD family type I secretion periplasmic adaptor subunit [Sphingopyxis sp.]|uniref:HlyD family type I secretion periplasmic adaptor subunit n=1 Tax=Sphingopyxis sp. TaxID=1908224 RepID=UPI002B4A3FCF|nr:HlyD family type I secretion periplasmic adaptor subunit [Sphingopyxis sp.]HJS12940.1 HlyD family type I secretion periplasmic adaptor subunit [Sphingopyxis sp.]